MDLNTSKDAAWITTKKKNMKIKTVFLIFCSPATSSSFSHVTQSVHSKNASRAIIPSILSLGAIKVVAICSDSLIVFGFFTIKKLDLDCTKNS